MPHNIRALIIIESSTGDHPEAVRAAAASAFEVLRPFAVQATLTAENPPFNEFPKDTAASLFTLANIPVRELIELPNNYWPKTIENHLLRNSSPWWLADTEFGLIEIGYRKRVMNIDWSRTKARVVVTEDDVTKNKMMVHAYSIVKAVDYLTVLSRALRESVSQVQV